MQQKASFKQIKMVVLKITKMFLDIIAQVKRGNFTLTSDAAQLVIHMEDKTFLSRLAEYMNNGLRIGLLDVIDFDAFPNLNFRNGKVDNRLGIDGLHRFSTLKIKAVNKLRPGETSISGMEFYKRLIEDGEILINSNLIEFILKNQTDEHVREFLKKHAIVLPEKSMYGTHLYAFGDLFIENGNQKLIHVWGVRQEKDTWSNAISYLSDTSFDEDCFALVIEKEK